MEALKGLKDGRPIRAIGLMSGTSLDGVDAALLETDGQDHVLPLAHIMLDYTDAQRAILQRAVELALSWDEKRQESADILAAEAVLHDTHTQAIAALTDGSAPAGLIGFHGQTVLHRPHQALTWQIGDGGVIADRTGVPVVYDFRHKDVSVGGQGAPLAPVYHAALARQVGLADDAALLNLGGVANLTLFGDDLIAFDTGPANGLLDQWVAQHDLGRFDDQGRLAAAGQVDEAALAALLAHPYFAAPPPKSLDRYDFDLQAISHLSVKDGAATLVAFTAKSIGRGLRQTNKIVTRLIVAGGGARNPVLMAAIARETNCQTIGADEMGWHSDGMEAECFAYLAARSVRGLPLSMPGTTGVAAPQSGGRLVFPQG